MPIGIVNLPHQQYRLVKKKGTTFTVIIVGESGLGKSTFINTLFATNLSNGEPSDEARHAQPIRKTTEIAITRAELEEKDFMLRLNIIDTPGFGDNINNAQAWQPIVDFIDDQHESHMQQDQQPERASRKDMRVHACLYFVRPTGQGLKPLEIDAMRALSTRVNVIPVIAKADTLDPEEMKLFKDRMRETLEAQHISIYRPHDLTGTPLTDQAPYSVIGSEREVQNERGEMVRGRQYLWGTAEVENDEHCDFKKLRNLLLRTHMLDLISSTQDLHYEAYRSQTLATRKPGETRSRKQINPAYKEKEQALRKAFGDQVNTEVARFSEWEKNLMAERDKLIKDLEETHATNRKLQEEIQKLKVRA